MKVIVCSDSHGAFAAAEQVLEQQPKAAAVIFLGDGAEEWGDLHEIYPEIPFYPVRGNCDWGSCDQPERLLEMGGVRIFMLHGHTRNVKSSPMSALYAAKEYGAQVLLFGHTHVPLVDNDGSLLTLNPGAAGDPLHPTCGVLTIENGRADVSTLRL